MDPTDLDPEHRFKAEQCSTILTATITTSLYMEFPIAPLRILQKAYQHFLRTRKLRISTYNQVRSMICIEKPYHETDIKCRTLVTVLHWGNFAQSRTESLAVPEGG
jgi:hypothetical protein